MGMEKVKIQVIVDRERMTSKIMSLYCFNRIRKGVKYKDMKRHLKTYGIVNYKFAGKWNDN